MSDLVKHILVPTDFSTHSAHALTYAAGLAGRLGATIDLLHVVNDPFLGAAWSPEVFVAEPTDLVTDLARRAEAQLLALKPLAAREGAPVHTIVLAGPPERAIVEYAKTGHIDLIVMGTHGRSGLSHALLGSVTERVLRRAPCAVLTLKDIPEQTPQFMPQSSTAVV